MDQSSNETSQAQQNTQSTVGTALAQQNNQNPGGNSQQPTGGKAPITRGQWFIAIILFVCCGIAAVFGSSTSGIFVHIVIVIVSTLSLYAGILQFSSGLQDIVREVLQRVTEWIDEGLQEIAKWINTGLERLSRFRGGQRSVPLKSHPLQHVDWKMVWGTTSTLIVMLLLIQLALPISHLHLSTSCERLWPPIISYQSPTQENIGISGSEACFDFEKQNNDEHNIEQLIYTENQKYVPDTSQPHITLVVVVSLTGSDSSSIAVGKVVLQGALIKQKEYNEMASKKHLPPLRLLVANDGANAQYANDIAQYIIQLAENDKTMLGVMGWPFSTLTTEAALTTLEQKHIVSISPTLSSNDFAGAYSYLFHIVPPDLQQGTDGASFAEKQWHPKKVVVFVGYENPYSRSLATSFAVALEVKGVRVFLVKYAHDEDQTVVPGLVQEALSYQPDLIYFAGYANDFDPIRGNLLALRPKVPVMGGDGLYELGGYQQNDSNFQGVYFTTFASTYKGQNIEEPQPFSTYYSNVFDPLHLYPNAIDRAIAESDAILSYDATDVFLTAYLRSNHKIPLQEVIYQALQAMNDNGTGQGAVQGASGRISFGPDGTPEDKAILVLYANSNHNTCITAVYGTYQANTTGQTSPKPDCPASNNVTP